MRNRSEKRLGTRLAALPVGACTPVTVDVGSGVTEVSYTDIRSS